MRDPARISKIMDLLVFIWQSEGYTDLRFNQLISNLQHEYNLKHDGKYTKELEQKEVWKDITSYRPYNVLDLYNVEDEDWMVFLVEKVAEINGETV